MKSRILLFVLMVASCLVFFDGCKKGGQNSLGADFDRIDVLISRGEYREANSELHKLERKLDSSWDFIGVYRRYANLGETDSAINIIEKAYKKHKENAEICALYSYTLMKMGQIDDAAIISSALQGTRYGSLHAEAVLKQAELNGESEYFLPDLFSVYHDAYTGSKNSYWLRNAAIVGLMNGSAEEVALLRPERFASFADAFFWALVLFDGGNYGGAEEAMATARKLLDGSTRRERSAVSDAEFVAFYSDVFQALSESEKAETVRYELLSKIDGGKKDEVEETVLPYIYVNSAQWSIGSGDSHRASKLLSESVMRWPDFVPALICYGNFAYESSQMRKENETQRALRESGVATLEMQEYDNMARIPVSDANARMEASLAKTKDPLLYIAQLDLRYKTDKTLSKENKIADLWSVLERNTIGINEYPALLFEFALNTLIKNNKVDDALDLFQRYCTAHYKFDAEKSFWQEAVAKSGEMLPVEIEYAAWFASNAKLGTTAKNLYEKCVWGAKPQERQIDAAVSNASCINLAMIYSSFGDRKTALDLYSKTAGRTPIALQKAEILYRMALVYEADGNLAEATKNASIACSLNPNHADAQLLRSRLSLQQGESPKA